MQTKSDETASKRWCRRKGDRPHEILAAALDCFAERGFAACRLDDVAARAGITKGTLYLYFQSKEELFKAVVRESLIPNIAHFEEIVAKSSEPASTLLERLITMWPDVMLSSRIGAIPKLVIAEAGNFPDIARFYLEEVIERGFKLIGSLIRRGIKNGEFRKVDVNKTVYCVIAPILLTMFWKHSLEPHAERPLDAKALSRFHADMLLRGLAP